MPIELKNWTLTIVRHSKLNLFANNTEPCSITIPATVPGNFELDMVRAGLLEDPYLGTNITKLRDLEDCHLFYKTTFDKPALAENETFVLRFEGIDTYADIFVNNACLAESGNMFLPCEIPIPQEDLIYIKDRDNQLCVHIHPTMIRAQEHILPPSAGTFPFNYASLYTRKAPSSFGWDILCRAVSGGLWRPVYIDVVNTPAIRETFLYTRAINPSAEDHNRGYAELNLYYAVDLGGNTYYPFDNDKHPAELPNDYTITVEGVCNDCTFSVTSDLWHTCGNVFIPVHGAYLWYPKNAGKPSLYDDFYCVFRQPVV